MGTRTGNYPIGFRIGGSDWQTKDLNTLAKWAKASGFDSMDLGTVTKNEIAILEAAGLSLGTADLLSFGQIMSNDPGKRKEIISANVAYIKEAAAAGAKIFFTCIIPGDPSRARSENYALALD